MPARPSQGTRVFVSGLGPVTCLGFGVDDLAEGMSAMGVVKGADLLLRRSAAHATALVPEFDVEQIVGTLRQRVDAGSRCALAAGALAWGSAAVQHDEVDAERCGLSFATVPARLAARARHHSVVRAERATASAPTVAPPDCAGDVLAAQFGLHGYRQTFCGGLLSGAQALDCASTALRSGRADLMMAGGHATARDVLDELDELDDTFPAGAPRAAQGAAVLVLETEDGLEKREGCAFCELSSIVCRPVRGNSPVGGLTEVLRGVVRDAIERAGIWEGDIGIVFLSGSAAVHPGVGAAERDALTSFSEVPFTTVKQFVGETFAAGFPLECIAAADALSMGVGPPKVSFQGMSQGVEVWVERRPEPLMGDAALVAGCTPDLAAAAILRTV